MTSDEHQKSVEAHISASTAKGRTLFGAALDEILVIKYLPATRLQDSIDNQRLYASERAGFTWGDALYVAPVAYPRTTMMYGDVGVVATYNVAGARMFDASDSGGIKLYQEWITWQTSEYLELTTTVHANLANRDLRNEFRNRYQIDCVFFRPDEDCPDYVDVTADWWLAITNWDASHHVGSGFSRALTNLRWCVVGPDSFSQRKDGRGYEATIHPALSARHGYSVGHFSSLEADIRAVYSSTALDVVVCDFR